MARSAALDRTDDTYKAPNETTPLIADATTDPEIAEALIENNQTHTRDDDEDKPLPTGQIILLCVARLVEPIAFFGIFPFINQMVQRNGDLQEAEVGFYSGLIESLFSLTQMLTMIVWGRVSDRVGRKPVLVVSMFGVAVFTAVFGLATTLWQMVLFRCLSGAFAGTVVTLRTMISELSTSRTQARAFSFFSFANNLGIFVGPLIGGALADPVGQYGGIFKDVWFLSRFPYALSTFTTGCIGLIAAFITVSFVKETLPSKVSSTSGISPAKTDTKQLSMRQLITEPGVFNVLYLFCHIMLLAYAYTAVIPVFWFTSVRLGGFSLTPAQISIFMASTGAAQAGWILLVFPPLQQRYGTGWVLRACSIAYPLFFLSLPLLNALLRHADMHDVKWEHTLFWIIGPILLCLGVGVSMSFTAIMLAVNNVAPTPTTLGTLNGIALSLGSGVRAFTPALFTSIYAVGVENQILGGQLIWLVLIVWALGFVVLARYLPAKAEGRPKGRDGVEEEAL